jgi:hypothetical protein
MFLWMLVVIPVAMVIPTSRFVYWFGVESLFRAMVIAYPINVAFVIGIMVFVSRRRDKRGRERP